MKARDILGDADPRVAELLDFWNGARGACRFPAQADLNLTAVPGLLPNLFILDVLEDRAFRYRFIGSRIDEHMGMSLTGKVFTQTRSGRVLREITAFFARVAGDGVMGLLETRLPSERFEWVRYTRVGLPLADDHETANKILGLYLFEPTRDDAFDMPKIGDIATEELGEVESRFGDLD